MTCSSSQRPPHGDSYRTRTAHGGRVALLWVVVILAGSVRGDEAGIVPLRNAHAHNDYYHDRPLLDAIACGFCSVEADVFLVDGKLLVAHSRFELQPKNTLDALYLKPLATRVAQYDGRVYQDGPLFTLLIDFKHDGQATYAVLQETLKPYASMLTRLEDGKLVPGAVQIIISGDRPFDTIRQDKQRMAGVDGRLSDLDSEEPAHFLPLISDNWGNHFQWRGNGPMPEDEREKLREIVRKAHAAGRRVRLWATPESEAVWTELKQAGVDLINTDQLERLQAFLR